ncbi:unnamed protein product [Rhizopus stolonifer]
MSDKENDKRTRLTQSVLVKYGQRANHSIDYDQNQARYYRPTPPPDSVLVVHEKPEKSKDACCWGCLAALCLCFGIKECCTR